MTEIIFYSHVKINNAHDLSVGYLTQFGERKLIALQNVAFVAQTGVAWNNYQTLNGSAKKNAWAAAPFADCVTHCTRLLFGSLIPERFCQLDEYSYSLKR